MSSKYLITNANGPSRASDKAPTVRTRALSNFALVAEKAKESANPELQSAVEHSTFSSVIATPGSVIDDSMQGDSNMLLLIRHRTSDSKGIVRKAAISALCAVMQLPGYVFDRKEIKVFIWFLF